MKLAKRSDADVVIKFMTGNNNFKNNYKEEFIEAIIIKYKIWAKQKKPKRT